MFHWFRRINEVEFGEENVLEQEKLKLANVERNIVTENITEENIVQQVKDGVPKRLLPGSRIVIKSPAKGLLSRIDRAPDQAFSQRKWGDGVLLYPAQNSIIAPFDGVITQVADAKQAVGICDENGVELYIHVGIDTARFHGRGFTTLVQIGEEVREGQTLLTFDRSHIRANAISDATPVVVTNLQQNWKIHVPRYGNVQELEEIYEILVGNETKNDMKNI